MSQNLWDYFKTVGKLTNYFGRKPSNQLLTFSKMAVRMITVELNVENSLCGSIRFKRLQRLL